MTNAQISLFLDNDMVISGGLRLELEGSDHIPSSAPERQIRQVFSGFWGGALELSGSAFPALGMSSTGSSVAYVPGMRTLLPSEEVKLPEGGISVFQEGVAPKLKRFLGSESVMGILATMQDDARNVRVRFRDHYVLRPA